MTTQKLDALMLAIEAYRTSGGRAEYHARQEALRDRLRNLLEENERLLKLNNEAADTLADVRTYWEKKHGALRVAAQAVVQVRYFGYTCSWKVGEAIDALKEALN